MPSSQNIFFNKSTCPCEKRSVLDIFLVNITIFVQSLSIFLNIRYYVWYRPAARHPRHAIQNKMPLHTHFCHPLCTQPLKHKPPQSPMEEMRVCQSSPATISTGIAPYSVINPDNCPCACKDASNKKTAILMAIKL